MLYDVSISISQLLTNNISIIIGLGNTNENGFEKFSYDHFYIFWTNQTLWATIDICKGDSWDQLFYLVDSPHIVVLNKKLEQSPYHNMLGRKPFILLLLHKTYKIE